MKISVNYTQNEIQELKILAAFYVSDFVIRIQFSDGVERLIDFKSFLNKSIHPSIKKYRDETLFSSFSIIDGNLNWNDYDLIFPIENLHEGKI